MKPKLKNIVLITTLSLGFTFPSSAQTIEELVKKEINDGMFLGCVVMAGKPGEVIYHEAFGERDLGLPMLTNTMFDVASITKVAALGTALAILMTERPDISADHKVCQYLDGLTGRGGDEMTIRQLTTHTSGMDNNYLTHLRGQELMAAILSRDISWEPGSRYFYSCLGSIRLSEMIAQQSGVDFGEYCRINLFEPLGLTRTMFGNIPEEYRSNCIRTDTGTIGQVRNAVAWNLTGPDITKSYPIGNAGLFTTAEDLSKIAELWLQRGVYNNKTYFSTEIYEEFTKVQSDIVDRGHLWVIGSAPEGMSGKTFSHTGYTGQNIWIDPENQWYIIILSNWTHDAITSGRQASRNARLRIGERVAQFLRDH